MGRGGILGLAIALAGGIGCAGSTQGYTSDRFKERAPAAAPPAVLIMAPDVELYELTAGGQLEPKADWTQEAEKHVTLSLVEVLRARNLPLLAYEPPPQGSQKERDDLQLLRLHLAVLKSIINHHYSPESRLPGKHGRFDWTLGTGVQRLRGDKKADYVLFVFMRDSYASGGRVALSVLTSIIPFTQRASGGEQAGFASLVDLESGDIVWCNALYRRSGDLRTPEPAKQAVQSLLEGFPW